MQRGRGRWRGRRNREGIAMYGDGGGYDTNHAFQRFYRGRSFMHSLKNDACGDDLKYRFSRVGGSKKCQKNGR